MTWLLTVITGGIYLYVWAWRVATEINSAEGRTALELPKWRSAFLALCALAFVGFVLAGFGNPLIFFIAVLGMLWLFIWVHTAIGTYIKAKDVELSTGAKYSNAIAVLLFWVVANSGVAYTQAGLNRIIRHERARP
jgi:hypothetical protein